MTSPEAALIQSIKARLVRKAHDERVDPNLLLTRFATERFLYRLSRSPHAEHFVLKGALLLLAWLGERTRPTRDADLLGLHRLDVQELTRVVESICIVPCEGDGMVYDPATIRVVPIRREIADGGLRAELVGYLGTARLRVQVDVGMGDAVTPAPRWLDYPSLLDLPVPRLLAYQPETAIAEKVHAMVELGLRNSRLRDFFDVWLLAAERRFELPTLADAVRTTFDGRGTPIPTGPPTALTERFSREESKQVQWRAFLRKSHLTEPAQDFPSLVASLRSFLLPVLEATRTPSPPARHWPPGGPWQAPG